VAPALTLMAILKVFMTGLAMYWFLRLCRLGPAAPLRLQWPESQLGTMHLMVLATRA
jgi:hypothetical protein